MNHPLALCSMRSGASLRARGSCEQIAYLLIGRLREVFVPLPDRVKWLRRHRADDLVHAHPVLVTGLRCRNRDGDDDAGGLLLAERGGRGSHGRAGSETVINKNYCLTHNVRRGARPAVSALAPLQLSQLV